MLPVLNSSVTINVCFKKIKKCESVLFYFRLKKSCHDVIKTKDILFLELQELADLKTG